MSRQGEILATIFLIAVCTGWSIWWYASGHRPVEARGIPRIVESTRVESADLRERILRLEERVEALEGK